MARNLDIQIKVESAAANAQLAKTDDAFDQVEKSAIQSGAGVDKLQASLARLAAQGAAQAQQIDHLLNKIALLNAKVGALDAALASASARTKEMSSAAAGLGDVLGNVLEGFAERIGRQLGQMVLGFVSVQAVIGIVTTAFETFIGFLKDSVKAFADAEGAQRKMVTALQQQRTATPEVIQQFNNLATQFQNTTVFSDDLINSMQALLIQVGGVMPSQMEKALQASTDLASGLGIDLETATRLVAKAAAGHTETLGRYGIQVSEAALQTKGFDAVLEAINRQFGGQAAAQVETYAGQIAQAANAWNNFQEAVGKWVVMDPLAVKALRNSTDALKTLDTQTNGVSASWSDLVEFIGGPGSNAMLAALGLDIRAWEELADRANTADAAMRKALSAPSPLPLPEPLTQTVPIAANLQDVDKLALAIQGANEQLTRLTATQKQAAISAFAHGESVEHATKRLSEFWPEIGKADVELKVLHESFSKGSAAAKKWADAMVELDSAGQGFQGTLDTIDGSVVEAIKFYLEAGVSQEKLALVYDLTATQVKAVASALHDHTEAMKISADIEKKFYSESLKISKQWADETAKNLKATNAIQIANLNDELKLLREHDDNIAELTLNRTQLQLRAIDQWVRDEKEKLVARNLGWADAERNLAAIEQVANDRRAKLAGTVVFAINAETEAIIEEAIAAQATAAKMHQFGDEMQTLSGVFQNLSSVGGKFGLIAGSIGTVTSAVGQLSKAMGDLEEQGFNAATATSVAGGWLNLGLQIAKIAEDMDKAAKEEEKQARAFHFMMDAMADFQTTAALTTATVDKMEASFQLLTHGLEQNLGDWLQGRNDLNEFRQLILTVPAEMQKAVEALNLSDLIKELGGATALTAAQIAIVQDHITELLKLIPLGGAVGEAATQALLDAIDALDGKVVLTGDHIAALFKIIVDGGPSAARATQVLDKAMAALGQSAADTHGLVSQLFLDTIKKAKELGITLAETNKFIVGQLQSAAEGLNGILTNLAAAAKASFQHTLDDLAAGVHDKLTLTATQAKLYGQIIGESLTAGVALTQNQIKKILDAIDKGLIAGFTVTKEQAAGLTASIAASFAEMVNRGMSVKDALDALAPSIDLLQKALNESGIDGGAAFARIAEMARIAHDPIQGPLLQSILDVGQALRGLHNAGILDQTMFDGLTQTAVDAFNKLIAGGADSGSALQAIQPTLQTIWELEKRFGFSVDEATQKLIDQAVQQGIVGEQFESSSDRMADAMDRVVVVLEAIGKVLGADIPAAADKAAKAINNIPSDKTVHIHYDDPGPPRQLTPAPEVHHAGGMVGNVLQFVPTAPQMNVFHAGGMIDNVLQFVPRAHKGLSIDERLIVAQTGEGIVSRAGMKNLGRAGLQALNSGHGVGGGDVIQVTVHNHQPTYRNRQDEDDQSRRIADRISREVLGRVKASRR